MVAEGVASQAEIVLHCKVLKNGILLWDVGKAKPQKDAPPQASASVRDVEERLQRALGARVTLRQKTPQSGIVEVHYHSLDQLDGLLLRLCGEDNE